MDIGLGFFFDESSKENIQKICQKFFHISVHYEPHITIGVYSGIKPETLIKCLGSLVSEMKSLAISFGSIGFFPSEENVLFIAPIVTTELLNMHIQISTLMEKIGGVIKSPDYYRPGKWVPHCTLAHQVPRASIMEAFEIIIDGEFPSDAIITRLEAFDTTDAKLLGSIKLGGNQ